MKITKRQLKRVIREEMRRLTEKEARLLTPEEIEAQELDPSSDWVSAVFGDKPGEPAGERTFPARREWHKGTQRPKLGTGVDREADLALARDLGYEGTRAFNIQLQNQLKDSLASLGDEPPGPRDTSNKATRIAAALVAVGKKYPDDLEIQALVDIILGEKLGIDIRQHYERGLG
jgi:hypothetical protein